MQFQLSDFRGIHIANFAAAPIALLCGQNGQGKSSIIEGLAAVLDGNTQPYGLKKDDLERMIHRGEETCAVEIRDDEGRSMTARWPSADVSTSGAPFRATKYATGSKIYAHLDERARMTTLAEYLKTSPTRDQIAEALQDLKLSKEALEAIWTDTQKMGWDGAFEKHSTQATEAKGVWKGITRGTWGSKVGGTWRPNGWTSEHEACKEEELKVERAAAEKALEQAIGKVAINDQEKGKHQALTNNIQKVKEHLKSKEADGTRAKATLQKAEDDIRKIPVLPPEEGYPACPHCKKEVQILGTGTLRIPPVAMTAKERQKIEDSLSQATTVMNEALGAYQEAQNAWQAVKTDLDTAERSRKALEASDETAISAEALQELRDEVTRCASILGAKERIHNALVAHMAVMDKIAIVQMLAPEGLRKSTLTAKLEGFNQELAGLCEIASWAPVSVLENGSLQYGQTAYDMCSGGERMRCDIVIQIAFGMRDGSEAFLIDEADVLDGKGRNGLFALLQHSGKCAVVAMMLTSPKTAPDLESAGLGGTFWVNDATTEPLADVLAKTKKAA